MAHDGTLDRPLLGGSLAHGAPRRDLYPRVGKLANLGPDAATWANLGRGDFQHQVGVVRLAQQIKLGFSRPTIPRASRSGAALD
jgi:hypothetical protein